MAIARALDLAMQGVESRHRKQAERTQRGDRMVLYAIGRQALTFSATITSPYREEQTLVWEGRQQGKDDPFRVRITPDVVLPEERYVPGLTALPDLVFPRQCLAAHCHLAFRGDVHAVGEADLARIEVTRRAAEPAAALL